MFKLNNVVTFLLKYIFFLLYDFKYTAKYEIYYLL